MISLTAGLLEDGRILSQQSIPGQIWQSFGGGILVARFEGPLKERLRTASNRKKKTLLIRQKLQSLAAPEEASRPNLPTKGRKQFCSHQAV